jgi:hypothetical protein
MSVLRLDLSRVIISTVGNAILNDLKRRTTALNFIVFRRNTSASFTSRFFDRRRSTFSPPVFLVLQADVKQRPNTWVFAVFSDLVCCCSFDPPRRIIPTIGSDHGSIGISIRPTKSCGDHGCGPTFGALVLDLIGY